MCFKISLYIFFDASILVSEGCRNKNVVFNGTNIGRQEVYGGFPFFKTWSLWKVVAELTTWFSCLIYMKLFQTSLANEELTQKGVRAIFPLTTGRNQK